MPTLLDLTNESAALLAELDALEDGEISDELLARIDALVSASADKIDATLAICEEIEVRSDGQEKVAARLMKRATTGRSRVKFLKERIRLHLEATGQKRLETERYKLCVAVAGGKQALTVLVPPEELADRFKRTQVLPNTDAIRDAIERGEDVSNVAKLEERKTYLRVS